MRKLLVASVVATAAVIGFAVPVSAHMAEEPHPHTVAERQMDTPKTTVSEQKTRMHGRLDDAKKRVCENRVSAVKNIMTHSAEAGTRHLNAFKNIFTRVVDFYTKKQLQVANYEALKAEAEAKYTAAAEAIASVKNSPNLDCSSENPVGVADQFKGKIKAMHAAIKSYRNSVHQLIVAVKASAKAAEGSQQ